MISDSLFKQITLEAQNVVAGGDEEECFSGFPCY